MITAEGYTINVQCDHCKRQDTFYGITKKDAHTVLKQAHWVIIKRTSQACCDRMGCRIELLGIYDFNKPY